MADTGKISEVFDIPAIEKEKEAVSKLVADLWKDLEKGAEEVDLSVSMFGDSKKISDITKATDKFNAAQAKTAKQAQELTELQKQEQKLIDQKLRLEKQLITTQSDEAKQINQLKLNIAEKNKQQKEDIKLQGKAKDSIVAINAQVKKLTQQYNEMSKAERESAEGVELQEKIEGMNDSLKSSDKALGDNRRNVGNYESAMDGLPAPIARVSGAIKKFTAVLLANPIIAVIAGIVAAIGLLVKAFKSTDDGGTLLEARFEQISAIIDVVMDRISRLATGIASLLSGDFKKGIGEIGDAFSGMGDQIAEATRNAWDYIFALDALNDRNTSFISQEAELRNEIAKLKVLSEDQTKSEQVRKKALEESLEKEKEIADFRRKQAEETLKLELEKNAARIGVEAGAIRAIIEGDATIVESARKMGGTVADIWNFLGDENIETLETMYAAVLEAETAFFEKSKEAVTKITSFQKMMAAQRQTNIEKNLAAAAALEKELFDIRVKFGLISEKEQADREIKMFENSKAFAKLTEEEAGLIRKGIRAKYDNETISKLKSLDGLRIGLAKETAQTIEKIEQESWEERKARIEEEEAARIESMHRIKDQAMQLTASIVELVNAQFARQLELLDQQAQADEEAKERELEAAGDNAQKRNAIEKKFAQKEKERAAENLKIRQKQAKFNKVVGIVDATINTLVGVTKAFSDPGGILGIILGALILATGLATVATIASQPIPAFKSGRKGGDATLGTVGEVGTEAIVTKSGDVTLTPDRPSLAFLPEGASVIPHDELVAMAGRATMTDVPRWSSGDSGFAELKNEMMLNRVGIANLTKVVKDKKEAHITMDKRGIRTAMADGANWIEYINNKFSN